MKKLLLIAASLLILPVASLQAAGTGFKVGQKFNLKVTKVSSTKQIGYFGTATKNPIPSNVPKFRKGQKIAFTIAKKGTLSTSKFKIPFSHASKTVVEYNQFTESDVTFTQNAEIQKAGSKATGGTLSFFINDFTTSDGQPVFYTVTYTLD